MYYTTQRLEAYNPGLICLSYFCSPENRIHQQVFSQESFFKTNIMFIPLSTIMRNKQLIIGALSLFTLLAVPAIAQAQAPATPPKAPKNWFTKDPLQDSIPGAASDKALKMLQAKGLQAKPVIVAVLDSGVEIDHDDLKEVIWTNPGEIAGDGIDNDKNGYIDDVHGWNFIGGPKGNVDHENLELAREYGRLHKLYKDADPHKLKGAAKKDYQHYLSVKTEFEQSVKSAKDQKAASSAYFNDIEKALGTVKTALSIKDTLSPANLETAVKFQDTIVAQAATLLQKVFKQGIKEQQLPKRREAAMARFDEMINIQLNPDYDARKIVGDNPEDLSNRFYGNNDYEGPDAGHGTHVAGIIAAKRNNGVGIDGVYDGAKIMVVRCVPNGDERDKDVANAIRYAVDNGASVINMSFGKSLSPQKTYVDEAVRYAEEHDVLLVHAAGNNAENNDSVLHFPTDQYSKAYRDGLFKKQNTASNWLDVGALNFLTDERRAARFSNYGKQEVDLFAPGVQVTSTIPDNKYAAFNGTSMATPVVAGAAAMLRSYYPELSAAQIKNILMNSAAKVDQMVIKPGTKDQKIPFSQLSVSGGIIDTHKAAELAAKTKAPRKAPKSNWRKTATPNAIP